MSFLSQPTGRLFSRNGPHSISNSSFCLHFRVITKSLWSLWHLKSTCMSLQHLLAGLESRQRTFRESQLGTLAIQTTASMRELCSSCKVVVGSSMRLLRTTGNVGGCRFWACLGQGVGAHTEMSSLVSWLQARGETDVHTSLTVGHSSEGRALFTVRPIKSGERVLRVTRDLMITPDRLPRALSESLPEDVNEWSRLALFLLLHQHAGKASPWAPYIRCLPPLQGLHSTVFWRDEELELLRQSGVYEQTLHRKLLLKSQFETIQPVVEKFPELFEGSVTLEAFMHAYCTACSRSWGVEALGSIAMVPFVDFFNHDSYSRALLSYYEDEGFAEVIADRDYNQGSQMVITYGTLPNSSLALDFGFTLPLNPHDEVDFWMNIASGDPLRAEKLDLLHKHDIETDRHPNGSDSGGTWFSLREVSSPAAKGKGIPRTLRAFARVASINTLRELEILAEDAKRRKTKLAHRPLKDGKEARALKLLLNQVDLCQESHSLALSKIERASDKPRIRSERSGMARAVLAGELRVLRSVGAWLRPRAEGGGYQSFNLS